VNTIRVTGMIDADHRLTATVPSAVPIGNVEVVVLVPETAVDPDHDAWRQGIAREWHEELADTRQDIYDLSDGLPVNEAG
jgi:hypothetical protein